jgi:hypothetical protein
MVFLDLDVTDIEQMQYDEDYRCDLSKEELERILTLPEQVNEYLLRQCSTCFVAITIESLPPLVFIMIFLS